MSWFVCSRCQQGTWREEGNAPKVCSFCARFGKRKGRLPEEPSPMQENAIRILEEGMPPEEGPDMGAFRLGQMEKAWIVWYEDPTSPEDPHVFLSQASAEARIKELLTDIIGNLERKFDFSDEADEERQEQGSQLNDVKQLLAQGDVMGAHQEWEAFAEGFMPDQNVIVRRADIIP